MTEIIDFETVELIARCGVASLGILNTTQLEYLYSETTTPQEREIHKERGYDNVSNSWHHRQYYHHIMRMFIFKVHQFWAFKTATMKELEQMVSHS